VSVGEDPAATPDRGEAPARRPVRFTGGEGNRIVGDAILAREGAPVVLLLHGGGQTRHSWDGTAMRLAAGGMTTIAVDQRGHGESEWVASGRYGFDDFGGDVVAMAGQIRAEHGRAPIAIGASLGGLASLIAEGEAKGPLLAGLVLVDVTPRMERSGVEKVQGFMRERLREGFATIEEAADAIAAYLPHRTRPKDLSGLAKNLRLHPDGRWRWHWDPRFMDGPRAVGADHVMLERRLIAAAKRLKVPTLLVRGARSELVSEELAREFLDLVPHADYADVSDAGHMVAGDRNDAFTSAVVGFLLAEGKPGRPA
jgi:pimeloyl-ACP methyl ester carboxylesterase